MKNECKYFGENGCLCSACQSVRKAMEDAEKISKEEIDKVFAKAEEILKETDNQRKGDGK